MDFDGLLYRAVDPDYWHQPLSGDGAAKHAQRFNVEGMPTLYTAQDPQTVLCEKMQQGVLQPLLLIAIRARLTGLLDARDPAALARFGVTAGEIGAEDWQDEVEREGRSASQRFAVAVEAAGHAGMLVPSYAEGAGPRDVNVVLWHWEGLEVVDDKACLTRG